MPLDQPATSRLEARLRRELQGEVMFDRFSRGRYATDASIYQIEPLGVVVPRGREDVAAALQIAREEGVPVLPRGGGTSQCGQTVARALVLDCSKYMDGVVALDVEARRIRVQPGVVLERMNASLRRHAMRSEFDIGKLDKLPAVDILYGYQNSDKYGYLYEAAVKAGVKGIIIAAPGNGSISKATQKSATDAQKQGLAIVRSSRVGSGVVNRLPSDDTNKFIAADSLNPQKARILLMLALTRTSDPQKLQKYFDEY